jgi:glycosyltransferase involved in cell wall biosynthesis
MTTTSIAPLFTYDAFTRQTVGGLSRYVRELHGAFRRSGIPSTVVAPLHVSRLLDGVEGVIGVRIPGAFARRPAMRLAGVADRLVEPLALQMTRRGRPSFVLHRTYYSPVAPALRWATAITVLDMTHERYPGLFRDGDPTARQKRLWYEQADVVIAISHHTRHELLDLSALEPERVEVCHLGVTRREPDAATLDTLMRAEPFFLYVGNRRGYKNFAALLQAFARSGAARAGTRLVAFGGGKPTPGELCQIEAQRVADLVSFTAGDDSRLAAHYASAAALLYPSLDEGFGLPPLEAMLHGCPVAAAGAGAIPEVAGDAALLFDPADPAAIGDAIDRIAGDEVLRAELVTRGWSRAARFGWESTAASTLRAYESALRRAKERAA